MSLLSEKDWKLLLRTLTDGHGVLVLGPGAAQDPSDLASEPLTARLARKLAGDLPELLQQVELVSAMELPHVAQIYGRSMPHKRGGLELAVEEFYSPWRADTTDMHRDLAALPCSLCITTTPDRFLLNAFAERKDKTPIVDFYHFQPAAGRARSRQRVQSPPDSNPANQPLLYGLYGSLEEPDSLVLTENDLLEFLIHVVRESPPLHPYVTSRFADPQTSFLFVGFGFHQWYLRILLHVLKAGGHQWPSFAIENANFLTDPQQRETVVFYRAGHSLTFADMPWRDFARDLRRRYTALVPRSPEAAFSTMNQCDTPQADAPVAFLCHEHRDKPRAEELAESLRTCGVEVWLDKQSLRGGDNWARLIPYVLEKQTHYVVVLQSRHMLDKPESYFWREINFALERQRGFSREVRFIIPALLENAPGLPLPDLAHLQSVNLALPEGMGKLCGTIQEDWSRRQKMGGGL